MRDLQALIKFSDRIPFLYFEHCNLERKDHNIEVFAKEGNIMLPIGNISALFLGPGTNITHDAICLAGEYSCVLCITGEWMTKFYLSGQGSTYKSKNSMKQIKFYSDEIKNNRVIHHLYKKRFNKDVKRMTLPQLRGMEGNRVRTIYRVLAKEYGIEWNGRNYDRNNFNQSDSINKAITYANQLLYGVCYSAIAGMGYLPQLGFIHTGFHIAFVCDIADLYKASDLYPICFRLVAESKENIRKRLRKEMMAHIRSSKLMDRIVDDIREVFDDDINN